MKLRKAARRGGFAYMKARILAPFGIQIIAMEDEWQA
jgi:hypothetical protein